MSFRICENDGIVEVHAWGDVTPVEVSAVLRGLRKRDPQKEKTDIWFVGDSSVIPIASYASIVAELRAMCGPETRASRSAIVVSNELQRAAMHIFRSEAVGLPWEIGVFRTRAEAVAWLKAGEKTGKKTEVAGHFMA